MKTRNLPPYRSLEEGGELQRISGPVVVWLRSDGEKWEPVSWVARDTADDIWIKEHGVAEQLFNKLAKAVPNTVRAAVLEFVGLAGKVVARKLTDGENECIFAIEVVVPMGKGKVPAPGCPENAIGKAGADKETDLMLN